MPTLTAPSHLRSAAQGLYDRLLHDWDVEIVEVPRGSLGPNLGRTQAVGAIRKARIEVVPHKPGEDLAETLGHETGHVLWWPVTEILDHRDPRTVALIEPISERMGVALAALPPLAAAGLARAARDFSARLRGPAPSPAALAREGCTMIDPIALLIAALKAALSNADPAAAVQSANDILAAVGGMVPAVDDSAGEAAMEGEAPAAMMRRLLPGALARHNGTLAATGARFRAIFGAKTDDEAIALARADKLDAERLRAQTKERAATDATKERRELLLSAIGKTGLARTVFFSLDAAGEIAGPAEGYREGDMTLDGLRAFVDRLGGTRAATPLMRAATNDESGLAERARKSGMTIEQRREAEQNVNRGAAAERA